MHASSESATQRNVVKHVVSNVNRVVVECSPGMILVKLCRIVNNDGREVQGYFVAGENALRHSVGLEVRSSTSKSVAIDLSCSRASVQVVRMD